jgi:RNase P subunit RPR2
MTYSPVVDYEVCDHCGKLVSIHQDMTFRMSGLTVFVKCEHCDNWTMIPVKHFFQND